MSTQSTEDPGTVFYTDALERIVRTGVPFMVGGGYALREYAGLMRDTRDFDVFCKAVDYPLILQVLADMGCLTEILYPHWLAKAWLDDRYLDVIFSSPNGVCPVQDSWFTHANRATVLDSEVHLLGPEHLVFCKSFVQDRERFDGADINHVLRAIGQRLDWRLLLRLMEPHFEILFAHLMNFRYAFPSERNHVPEWVLRELWGRVEQQMGEPMPTQKVCRGVLLSESQYLVDLTQLGYQDVRALLLQRCLESEWHPCQPAVDKTPSTEGAREA